MAHFLLNDFKQYKNLDLTDTSDDSIIDTILYGVEGFLKTQYNIYLQPELVTLKFNGDGTDTLILPTNQIEIVNLYIDDILQDLSKFYLEYNVLKNIDSVFTKGIQNIKIDANLGYNELPNDLKLAVFILADKIYNDNKNNVDSLSTISDPNMGRLAFVNNIPKKFYIFINPYIIINL